MRLDFMSWLVQETKGNNATNSQLKCIAVTTSVVG